MNKKSKVVIKIAKVLAPILGSRDIIDSLKSRVLESDVKSVVLDFKNVQFASRSAAHELLLIQEEVSQKNKELSFENTNDDITKMLRIVAANRALPKHEKPHFKPEKIDINSLRKEVLA
ncbi:MAG: STAS domain-containing protein [Candidatus Pacebacteria bacterium]|nr:STAS domain-containing protein [Candidatus Paceibacterota bacterium]